VQKRTNRGRQRAVWDKPNCVETGDRDAAAKRRKSPAHGASRGLWGGRSIRPRSGEVKIAFVDYRARRSVTCSWYLLTPVGRSFSASLSSGLGV